MFVTDRGHPSKKNQPLREDRVDDDVDSGEKRSQSASDWIATPLITQIFPARTAR